MSRVRRRRPGVRSHLWRGQYDTFYSLLADALLRGAALPVNPVDAVEVIRLIERIHRDTR